MRFIHFSSMLAQFMPALY